MATCIHEPDYVMLYFAMLREGQAVIGDSDFLTVGEALLAHYDGDCRLLRLEFWDAQRTLSFATVRGSSAKPPLESRDIYGPKLDDRDVYFIAGNATASTTENAEGYFGSFF